MAVLTISPYFCPFTSKLIVFQPFKAKKTNKLFLDSTLIITHSETSKIDTFDTS